MLVQLSRADLVVVGTPGTVYAPAIDDLERRLQRYVKLRVREVKGTPLQRGEADVLRTEGERILAALDAIATAGSPAMTIAACDSRGEQLASEQLGERLLEVPHLVLVVGGAFGLAPEVLARCSLRIGFGRITLPHQLARVVLTEQLYRAFRIARGEPYHH